MSDQTADDLNPKLGTGFVELEERLRVRLSGRVFDLQLSQKGSGIVLRGLARTYRAKELALMALMMETRQPIVANEIEVR